MSAPVYAIDWLSFVTDELGRRLPRIPATEFREAPLPVAEARDLSHLPKCASEDCQNHVTRKSFTWCHHCSVTHQSRASMARVKRNRAAAKLERESVARSGGGV